MKKLIIFLLVFPAFVAAQNINGRFTSSVYGFQRFQNAEESDVFIRSFQTLYLNVNKNNFALRTRFNLEGDIKTPLDNDPRLRLYTLYFEARRVLGLATVRVGRQTLYNGVAEGLYDGLNLKLRKWGFVLSGFYGGNVPPYQKIAVTDSWSNDFVAGGKLKYAGLKDFLFAVSYINKNFKPMKHTAYLLDSLFNPVSYLIQRNSTQFEFVSGEAGYYLPHKYRANVRLDYDLNFLKVSKLEFSGRVEKVKNLGVELYYNYRSPRIRYNSIFSVFDYGNTSELELGLDYKISPMFTLLGKYGVVKYRDNNSKRVTTGFYSSFGSLIYRKTFGYAGELDAISISIAKSYFNGTLTPTFGLAYTAYKLSEASELNKLVSLISGFNVRLWKHLSFDIQGQYLNNKIYNNDFRLFVKLNYWFNTNLSEK